MDRHHNQPPLADRLAVDHAELVKQATEAAALVPEQIRAIETDEEAGAYTDTAANIKAVLREADAAFKAEKAPWLAGGRAVDGFFQNISAPMAAAVDRVVKALNARQTARLAAERKAAAEAAEKARKEAVAFDEPVPVTAPVVVREAARVVSIATGAKATGSIKYRPRVVDIEQVPRQYMMVNERALQAAVDGGIRSIPGVEVYEEVRTSIRR